MVTGSVYSEGDIGKKISVFIRQKKHSGLGWKRRVTTVVGGTSQDVFTSRLCFSCCCLPKIKNSSISSRIQEFELLYFKYCRIPLCVIIPRASKVRNKGPKDIMAVEELNGDVKFSTQLPYPNNLSRFAS